VNEAAAKNGLSQIKNIEQAVWLLVVPAHDEQPTAFFVVIGMQTLG
jgi:hypothetical protein